MTEIKHYTKDVDCLFNLEHQICFLLKYKGHKEKEQIENT